jgi:hypothetical protein
METTPIRMRVVVKDKIELNLAELLLQHRHCKLGVEPTIQPA